MRAMALPHYPFDWIRWTSRGLSMLWAGFWIFYCVGSAIVASKSPAEFMTDIATAVVFCAVTVCAWCYERAGGLLLIALAVIAFLSFHVYSRPFSVWLVFSAPPLTAGILFSLHSRQHAQ